ncbi:ATP-binding cassette domain-containing protein [Alphaproteobacteria bacterium KMM 3653]|uniref:ATP-binding cassette domain-containing protein n=2 Tax=Harenicola maris TaxID=2841044 RepID=A0AAP2G434_9RHOB|nr:ATP-binding cassette domain-containing protein [Harenicola maris]
MPEKLVEVVNLSKSYQSAKKGLFRKSRIPVLRNVDLQIAPGEILGLVGESGSGKSTLGKAVLKLIDADEGDIVFDGQNLGGLTTSQLRARRKDMQIIFQDPYASLDPRKTVRAALSEALETHGLYTGDAQEPRLEALMKMVGLSAEFLGRLPHEFSGGQRQRIGIARALAVEPRFIVADEAVSALDVSIQAQVLNLLADLRRDTGVAMLFISHDLSVVRFISDRVMVLYLGRVMEVGPANDVHFAPAHPYTAALVSAEPSLKPKGERIGLKGEIPSPMNPPSGCVFRSRCPFAIGACDEKIPELRLIGQGRYKACIRDDILKGAE